MAVRGAATTVLETPQAVGALAAELTLQALLSARRQRGVMTLGCPAGRSPGPTYAALAQLAAERGADLSPLRLIMMDEYVAPSASGWTVCPPDAHYSCARYAEVEIRGRLNAALPAKARVRRDHLLLPDPNAPEAYEDLIESLGGIDVFLLAAGASDGHVAFNPPGSPREATTRVVEIAELTRRDNVATFPDFAHHEEVPRFGVTVGPATIARWSASAIMIVTGEGKREALRRLTATDDYDPDWPATVVHACANARILADAAAAEAAR